MRRRPQRRNRATRHRRVTIRTLSITTHRHRRHMHRLRRHMHSRRATGIPIRGATSRSISPPRKILAPSIGSSSNSRICGRLIRPAMTLAAMPCRNTGAISSRCRRMPGAIGRTRQVRTPGTATGHNLATMDMPATDMSTTDMGRCLPATEARARASMRGSTTRSSTRRGRRRAAGVGWWSPPWSARSASAVAWRMATRRSWRRRPAVAQLPSRRREIL